MGLARREPRRRLRAHGVSHARQGRLRRMVPGHVAREGRRAGLLWRRRRALHSAAKLEIAAHRDRLSRRDDGAGGRAALDPRSPDGRPGARRARKHRHAVLGRRGAHRGRGSVRRARLPRAHRLRRAGAVLMREGVRTEIGTIPAIDGLRGVAVLWVVAFHYVVVRSLAGIRDPWIEALARAPLVDTLARSGYLGVDLFFLISGFLLAAPWFVHARAGIAPPSVPRFYARRVRRIVPAYYLQLVFLFALVLPLLHGRKYWRSDVYVDLWNAAAHALFLQNSSPLTSGSLGANGALWTLAVEAQFYLVLPLVMPCFVRAPWRSLAAA